jgi:hypothetical protein
VIALMVLFSRKGARCAKNYLIHFTLFGSVKILDGTFAISAFAENKFFIYER